MARSTDSLQAWRDAGHITRLRGHDLFVRRDGDTTAPVLLALHGFPTAGFDWLPLWPALRARFQVIAPDFLGFGFSAKPSAHDYSFFEQADLIEALLAQAGVTRYHLLAHDYGVTVAQELLARDLARDASSQTARPLSVALLNGGIFPEAQKPRPIQKLLAGPMGFLIARLLGPARFKRNFRAIFGAGTQPSEELLDDCWALIAQGHGQRITHRLGRYLHERKRFRDRWVGALQAWRGPKYFIDGVDDPISGAAMVARWRELIGADSVRELRGIGHYPQIEAPEAVLAALVDFWRGAVER